MHFFILSVSAYKIDLQRQRPKEVGAPGRFLRSRCVCWPGVGRQLLETNAGHDHWKFKDFIDFPDRSIEDRVAFFAKLSKEESL